MFFSVIVPIYNVAPYLRECLDSLVNQTCTDKEIILIDDGSTDGSEKICDEYATKYNDVKVIHQKNQGLSGARNTGLEHAKGEWISFIDSDDYVEVEMLECMQGYILATSADMYRFGYMHIRKDSAHNEISKGMSLKDATISTTDEQSLFRCYLRNYKVFLNAWGGVYRHSIIREHKLRFFNTQEICCEDVLFNFQYILHSHKILTLHYSPYHYRKREGSLTYITGIEQRFLGIATLLERAYQTTKQQNLIYFQKYFYKIYIEFLNFQILAYASNLNDVQLRLILDKMLKSKLYRKCVKKKLNEDGDRPIIKRIWYRKSFGKNSKSAFKWRAYLLLKSIKYAIKDAPYKLLPYAICKEQRVAYLVNFKGACSTIIVSMLKRDDIEDDYSVFKKDTGLKILRYVLPIRSKDWFTFTFVRNPFARLVSCYESKYHEDITRNRDAIHRGYLDYDYYLDGYIKEDKGFENFVKQIVLIPHPMADYHFCSQYYRFIDKDGQPKVDFIGKVESLKEDYEPIRQKYGFDSLMHYNKVDYGDWRDYYTTKLAKMVYKKYKKDVQYFGYEKEYQDLLEYCKQKEERH